jgi:hypothetical protein
MELRGQGEWGRIGIWLITSSRVPTGERLAMVVGNDPRPPRRREILRFALVGRSGIQNQETAFEDGLQDPDESVGLGFEAGPEAVLGLAKNVVEISPDGGIGASPENGDEETELSLPNEGEAMRGEIEGGFQSSFGSAEPGGEIPNAFLDAALRNVAAGIVMGVGDQAKVFTAQEVSFLDLVAMRLIEYDVVVGARREESAQAVNETIESTQLPELARALHLLGERPSDGAAQHGLQEGLEVGLRIVARFMQSTFNDGGECIGEIAIAGVLVLSLGRLSSPLGLRGLP